MSQIFYNQEIRKIANQLAIDAIGFTPLSEVQNSTSEYYKRWIDNGNNADMHYLEEHTETRNNPSLLLPDAHSAIIIAVNYKPQIPQDNESPKIATYALGRDYHKVMKQLLLKLGRRINNEIATHTFRALVDTAPFMERYWAQCSGIGFIGKNSNLIIPSVGSYCFIGVLLTSLQLVTDLTCEQSCGDCMRCIKSCPMGVLSSENGFDARRCINYLTIEYRGDIPEEQSKKFGKRLYGCDTCQEACPHNYNSVATVHFPSSPKLLHLKREDIEILDEDKYAQLFYGTAATRAKYEGMRRNAAIYLENNP